MFLLKILRVKDAQSAGHEGYACGRAQVQRQEAQSGVQQGPGQPGLHEGWVTSSRPRKPV